MGVAVAPGPAAAGTGATTAAGAAGVVEAAWLAACRADALVTLDDMSK